MPRYFSPGTCAFYDSEIHAQLPGDARAITAETHAALLDEQALGKRIVANDNGDPVAIDPPPPDAEELLAQLRQRRDRLLTDCDWTQVLDSPLSAEDRSSWAAYRQALRDLPQTTSDLTAIDWPIEPTSLPA